MRKLDHKNILKLFEVYESASSIYLVMEVLKGGELLKAIKEKLFNFNEIERAKVMRNILEALHHIHKKGIMHRDLKPENILLKDDKNLSNIVIADFGLASFIHIEVKDVLFKKCGTPGFVAPEILEYKENINKFYDERCDTFSAGAIFYLLCVLFIKYYF